MKDSANAVLTSLPGPPGPFSLLTKGSEMTTLERDLKNVDKGIYLLANAGEFIRMNLDENLRSCIGEASYHLALMLRYAQEMRDELKDTANCECDKEMREYVEFIEKMHEEEFNRVFTEKFFEKEELYDLSNKTSDFVEIYHLSGRKSLSSLPHRGLRAPFFFLKGAFNE